MKSNNSYIISVLIFIILFLNSCGNEKELKWTAINVNNSTQGDAQLISKGDTHFLIDGGAYVVAQDSLLAYLKNTI